jgi:hypothetical protein
MGDHGSSAFSPVFHGHFDGGTEHPPCGPLDSNPSISNTPKSENTTSEKGTKGQARGCFYGYFIMVFLPPLEVGVWGPYIHLWGPSGMAGSS